MFVRPVLRRVSAHHRETNRRTKQMRISLFATLTAAMVASVAVAKTIPTKIGDSTKGKVLTSDNGMTLYVFDRDADGKSACNVACTGLWPPLAAPASATATGDYTIDARDNRNKQWAYAELAKSEKGREQHLQKQAGAQRSVPEEKLLEAVREVLARHRAS
jgi:predicted lipoprotein with Yx(FWY)xxD motif